MELKQLQFLVVCAQTRSFSNAASQLYTAQSNVSKVIKSLEDELGIELFERKQYGISLTEQGKKVYKYALDTLKSAQQIIDFTKEEQFEELRISSNPSSWMAVAFRDYYNQFGSSHVNYHVMSASTNEIIQRLSNDEEHLGFIYVMEEQLPTLLNTLQKKHISISILKKTGAMLYFGSEEALNHYRQNAEQPLHLVQGYEDEFTLKAFLDENREEGEKQKRSHRVAVTTNSDYVMSELLRHTNLGNISGGYLTEGNSRTQNYISLYEDQEAVMFGCLFRNDRNMGKLQKEFLQYIKERLQNL